MQLILRFTIVFLILSSVGLLFKYGVDTCLPDAGSRIFNSFFKLPQGACTSVMDMDLNARRNTRIDAHGIHFGKYSTSSNALTGVTWLAMSRPTIFFQRFPKNPTFLAVFFILTFVTSMAIASAWHLAWISIDRQVMGTPVTGPQVHPAFQQQKDFTSATRELISDEPDKAPQGALPHTPKDET